MLSKDTLKIFTPEQEQRLEAIREGLAPLEERRAELCKQRRKLAGDDEKATEIEAEVDRLDAEMEPLKLEEKQLEFIEEFAEELEGKINPKLAIADALIKVAPGPAAELAAAAAGALLETFERLDDVHARYRRLIAKQRMNAFKAYQDAGFTSEHAFSLVEADAQASSPLDALRNNFKVDFKA